MKVGQQVSLMKLDGTAKSFRVTKIFGFQGLKRVEIEEAKAGDLVAVSGMEDINALISSIPETATRSPAFASSISTRFKPWKPKIFVTRNDLAVPSSFIRETCCPTFIVPRNTRPIPIRPT